MTFLGATKMEFTVFAFILSYYLNKKIGTINFWVSGDGYPNFTNLYCDLVFVINKVKKRPNVNAIKSSDKFVDNMQCYNRHYK